MSRLMEKGPMTRDLEKAFLDGNKDMLASGERRTFGQVLGELLDRCAARRTDGFSKKKLIDDLAASPFNDGETKRSSVEKKISRWLKDEARPEDRALLFQLCIIMKLTEEEARYLFERGLMASWTHWANRNELIYDFCLKMGYDIDRAYELINSENGIKGAGGRGMSVRMSISEHSTKMIGDQYKNLTEDWEDEDEENVIESFNDFLRQNAHYFREVSKTRLEKFKTLYGDYVKMCGLSQTGLMERLNDLFGYDESDLEYTEATSDDDDYELTKEEVVAGYHVELIIYEIKRAKKEADKAAARIGAKSRDLDYLKYMDKELADIVKRALNKAIREGEEDLELSELGSYIHDILVSEYSNSNKAAKITKTELADKLRSMRLPDAGDIEKVESGDKKKAEMGIKRIKKLINDDKSGTENPIRHDISDYLNGKKDIPRDVMIKMFLISFVAGKPDKEEDEETVNDMLFDVRDLLYECGYPDLYVRAADGFDALIYKAYANSLKSYGESGKVNYEEAYRQMVKQVIGDILNSIEKLSFVE